jgi:signal transduction histidine kinase/ActR/RegA family two-component response regulator
MLSSRGWRDPSIYRMRAKTEQEELLKREQAARSEAEAARGEAEAARSRLAFLSEASRVLGSSLDYETTLGNLARLVVPQFGDFCVVDLAEEGERIRRVAVADIDPKREELVRRIALQHPLSVHSAPSYSRVLSTGESEWLPEVTDEMCLALPQDVDPDVLRSLKFRSFICVPLPIHGQILGTISIARSTPGANYSSADLMLAEELARRAGMAVDHARLYRTSQEANRVKDEFLATLSHELRSPLSSALLCAQMLRRGILDSEKTARALETIERKIDLEVRLVDDLIDIARINTGKISLEIERVDLATIVQAAVESARSAAEAQGARLQLTCHELDVPIQGDEARLQQVMGNLLSNAIKFTPQGGSIDVGLERVGAQARISVRDTGIGISAKAISEVFDRFRQVDKSLTRRYGGLGLGLSIVRNLVELQGGKVTAESAGEGLGSTFAVTLPLLPSSPYVASPPFVDARDCAVEMEDLRGVRVMVVDDDEDARDSMATLLMTCGATVTTAASAREALEVLQREGKQQDVLVSDISMPDVDGYALLRAIRAQRSGGAAILPAIAVTAYARPADRRLALAAGYRLHLSKPVDQRVLVAAVADLAGRRPPRAAKRPSSG